MDVTGYMDFDLIDVCVGKTLLYHRFLKKEHAKTENMVDEFDFLNLLDFDKDEIFGGFFTFFLGCGW